MQSDVRISSRENEQCNLELSDEEEEKSNLTESINQLNKITAENFRLQRSKSSNKENEGILQIY